MKRYFTLDEANAALAAIRPLAERMVRQHALVAEARDRLARITAPIAGNGGGLAPSELAEARAEVAKTTAALRASVEEIHATGAMVKDTGRGLVDFLAEREGEDVLLCWHVGEDDIAYWHGLEEGFAGRKPLPL